MMSSGGLTAASLFQGKDAVLSGPAGGVVGAVHVGRAAGFDRMIGFDMGGTSTDVCHFAGAYERSFDSDVAGIALRAPMMRLHTVAAGGGRFCIMTLAASASDRKAQGLPGPVAYRNGGPLSVTDANIMTGRITPDHFPALFGPDADQALDADATRAHLKNWPIRLPDTGHHQSAEELAEGFLRIANENMAQAIKKYLCSADMTSANMRLCALAARADNMRAMLPICWKWTRFLSTPCRGFYRPGA